MAIKGNYATVHSKNRKTYFSFSCPPGCRRMFAAPLFAGRASQGPECKLKMEGAQGEQRLKRFIIFKRRKNEGGARAAVIPCYA